MSAPRRRGLPRRKPDTPKRKEVAEELPELEPVAEPPEPPDAAAAPAAAEPPELPELEPIDDDSPIKVTLGAADSSQFDTVVEVTVPDMDKKAIAAAVEPVLQTRLTAAAAQLRHRRVLVRFGGEGIIGSAVKELVTTLLKPVKPLRAVIQRGYGDELLFEGTLPAVQLHTKADGDTTTVEVATGELEATDIPVALTAALPAVTATAKGRRFVFQFRGNARPDATIRALLRQALGDAGATSCAVGARVLFDRELERAVQVQTGPSVVQVLVTPLGDAARTADALSLILPEQQDQLRGKEVQLRFATPPRPETLAQAIELCQAAGPKRLVVGDGKDADVVLPKLLTVGQQAGETLLKIAPSGRSHAALIAAFRRECPTHGAAIQGKTVVVDWPADVALDAELEAACIGDTLATLAPNAVACTFAGELREPFLPAPLLVTRSDQCTTLRLSTDAGKPADLLRAIERRVPQHAAELRGRTARLEFAGAAAPSRTLLRALIAAVEKAGATRVELSDGDGIDVLIPPLLEFAKAASGGFALRVSPADRSKEQVQRALARELDVAALPKGALVALGASTFDDVILQALVARGTGRVLREDGLQIHPRLFATPERQGQRLQLVARPDADAAIVARQLEHELPMLLADAGDLGSTTVTLVWPGATDPTAQPCARAVALLVAGKPAKLLLDAGSGKPRQLHPEVVREFVTVLGAKDGATPPLVMFGIDVGDDEAHVAQVVAKLQPHRELLTGRTVLLVGRDEGHDVPLRDDMALVTAVRSQIDALAAAVLLFRGPDRQRRPHFTVVHSTSEALAVGSVFGDPRRR